MAGSGIQRRTASKENGRVLLDGHDLDVLFLGLMADQSARGGEVHVTAIEAELHRRQLPADPDEIRGRVERLLDRHRWFGLAWTDTRRVTLAPIAGVRWFCESEMYKKLVTNKPAYNALADGFASVVADFHLTYNAPRLLVDAGSTTFHCLFHDGCERLRKQARKLLTNNLFVALRWQEEFKDKGNVFLIGGMPHLDTAATIENEKLHQWLKAKSRCPDLSLLSWHYVRPEGKSVTFCTADPKELEMKKAAMDVTTGRIYIVWHKDKVAEKVPQDAKGYTLGAFLDNQRKIRKKNPANPREVYVITDIADPTTPAQQQVIDALTTRECKEAGVNLVCPATGHTSG